MNISTKRSVQALVAGSALIGPSFVPAGVSARPQETGFIHNGQDMPRPVLIGTVTAISDDTLKVSSVSNSAIYTVDAANAAVMKARAAADISAIIVGDGVIVQGTATGTHVVATEIMDSIIGRKDLGARFGRKSRMHLARTAASF